MTDELLAKIKHAGVIVDLMADLIGTLPPGEYRFRETYPEEYREYVATATELQRLPDAALSRIGLCMQHVVYEFEKFDHVSREDGATSRKARRQAGRTEKAFERLTNAIRRLMGMGK